MRGVIGNNSTGSWTRFLAAKRSTANRYLTSLAVCLVFLILVGVVEYLENVQITSLALVSVLFGTIYGGRGPGILVAIVSAIGVDYYYTDPQGFIFTTWVSSVQILIYVAVGVLIANLIASLRQAFQDLASEKRARENVLNIVAHDLRSPLSSILMNADLVERQILGGKPLSQPKQIQRIRGSAIRMNRLIEDLLDAAKMETGQFRMAFGLHEVGPIVLEAIENAQAQAIENRIKVVPQISAAADSAYCDRDRVLQVLNNLLNNAIKFSPQEGTVVIQVQREKDWLRFAVRDQGQGIPKDALPRLFVRSWQATETAHKGTGLGLLICKRIVEGHGGQIGVDSTVGQGTTFYFSLPSSSASLAHTETRTA